MDDAGGGRRGLRPTVAPALAAVVHEVWGLDLEHARDLGGSTGLNLLVPARPGRMVVRVHRRHVTAARVEALQLAREAAAVAGLPAARMVLGRDGQRTAAAESCVVEVERFVESDAKMDSVDRIHRAMPMLTRVHQALSTAPLPDAADDLRFANYLAASEVVMKTAAGARRMRTIDPSLRQLAEKAERLADRVAAAQDATEPLEDQWCHGDHWDDNVLFRADEIVLVADFGFMNRRPRIDDLALTLWFTLWELDATGHHDPCGVLASLVDSYDTGASQRLSIGERGALPVAMARQPLWSIAVWAAELDDPEAVRVHLRGHERALDRAQSIIDNIDQWRVALARKAGHV